MLISCVYILFKLLPAMDIFHLSQFERLDLVIGLVIANLR